MSRKKKETPPAKGHRINLRITEELYNVLQNEASASNLTAFQLHQKLLSSRQTQFIDPQKWSMTIRNYCRFSETSHHTETT